MKVLTDFLEKKKEKILTKINSISVTKIIQNSDQEDELYSQFKDMN